MDDQKTVAGTENVVRKAIAENTARESVARKFKVITLDMTEGGFLPKYEAAVNFKEAFTNFESTNIQMIRDAKRFLMSYIVSPETDDDKLTALNQLTVDELLALFRAIMGADSVSP